jgi:hypothetical protein
VAATVVEGIDPRPCERCGRGHREEGLFKKLHGKRYADILD